MNTASRKYLLYAISVTLLLILCGCEQHIESAERNFFALDTYITIQAVGPDAKAALETVERQIQARENQWSVTNPDSEIYAINRSNG